MSKEKEKKDQMPKDPKNQQGKTGNNRKGSKSNKYYRENRTNDAKWYKYNPELAETASHIPFNQMAGEPLRYTSQRKQYVDGIMRINMTPVFAGGRGQSSVLNNIAKNQYSFIRHANSGHTNYEASDLMITELAITQVYSFYAWMARIYGIMNLYSATNRYLPEGIARAIGIDLTDFQKHQSDMYTYMNIYAAKINQFYVPKLPLYEKLAYIYADVFLDGVTSRAQMYVITTNNWFKYYPHTSTQGGMLKMEPLRNAAQDHRVTFDEMVKYGDDLILALTTDEDIGIISGDILKAYGENGCIGAKPIAMDYKIKPILDTRFIAALENAMILNAPNTNFTNELKQQSVGSGDDSMLVGDCHYSLNLSNALTNADFATIEYAEQRKPLLMHVDNPSVDDILDATRYMFTMRVLTPTAPTEPYKVYVDMCDLFIITGVTFYNRQVSNGLIVWEAISQTSNLIDITANSRDFATYAKHSAAFSASPHMVAYEFDVDTEDFPQWWYYMNWDNQTLLTNHQIDKLNEICLLSEFEFPNNK